MKFDKKSIVRYHNILVCFLAINTTYCGKALNALYTSKNCARQYSP